MKGLKLDRQAFLAEVTRLGGELTERAYDGRITGFAVVIVNPDGTVTASCGCLDGSGLTLLAGTALVHRDTLDSFAKAES